jgi:RNA polymerase sigma-70 factor (ECF subfamily)
LRLTTSEQAAGELIQDLFLRLYESEAFARAENGFSYAWKTAVNLAVDWRRNYRTERPLDHAAPMSSSHPSPLDTAISIEDTQRVLDAVARLDEPGRSVVILYFLEQQSYEQIADRLDKNPNHLRSICFKAVSRLRQDLAAADKGDAL